MAWSSSGLGHRPLKAKIGGSNPLQATTEFARSPRTRASFFSERIRHARCKKTARALAVGATISFRNPAEIRIGSCERPPRFNPSSFRIEYRRVSTFRLADPAAHQRYTRVDPSATKPRMNQQEALEIRPRGRQKDPDACFPANGRGFIGERCSATFVKVGIPTYGRADPTLSPSRNRPQGLPKYSASPP